MTFLFPSVLGPLWPARPCYTVHGAHAMEDEKNPALVSKRHVYQTGDSVDCIVGGTPEMALPGSKEYTCCDCGTGVWLALSGQRIQKETNAKVICLECFVLKNPGDKSLEMKTPSVSDIVSDILGTRKQ